jgi:hypothetical protein
MVSIRTRIAAHSAAMGKSLPQAGRKWLMNNLGSKLTRAYQVTAEFLAGAKEGRS